MDSYAWQVRKLCFFINLIPTGLLTDSAPQLKADVMSKKLEEIEDVLQQAVVLR